MGIKHSLTMSRNLNNPTQHVTIFHLDGDSKVAHTLKYVQGT